MYASITKQLFISAVSAGDSPNLTLGINLTQNQHYFEKLSYKKNLAKLVVSLFIVLT